MKSHPHRFRNLTPHKITIVFASELAVHTPTGTVVSEAEVQHLPAHELHYPESWSIEPEATAARVSVESTPAGYHRGIPIAVPTYGEATGLPAPTDGVLLIVSKMVADALPERADLVWPGDPVRDGDGRVIGCRCLHRRGVMSQDGESRPLPPSQDPDIRGFPACVLV